VAISELEEPGSSPLTALLEPSAKPSRPCPSMHRIAVGAALLVSVACGALVAVVVMLTYKLAARMIVG
jgi:hypothetical protein